MAGGPWDRFKADAPADDTATGPWDKFSGPSAVADEAANVPVAPDFSNVTHTSDTVPDEHPKANWRGALSTLFQDVMNPVKGLRDAYTKVVKPIGQGVADARKLDALKRGAASTLATTGHAVTDFVDQTVGEANPFRVLEHAGAFKHVTHADGTPLTQREIDGYADPLGTRAAAAQTLAVEHEINADRQAAAAEAGTAPSIADYVNNPAEAFQRQARRITEMGTESSPAMAVGMATMNPELAAGIIGGSTGAQEYTDLRDQGVGRADAAQAGALTGLTEAWGESLGLPKVFGKEGSNIFHAIAAEGGQEFPVQIMQQNIEDQATGQQTPIMQQLSDAFDALQVGGATGGMGHVGTVYVPNAISGIKNQFASGDAPRSNAVPPTPEFSDQGSGPWTRFEGEAQPQGEPQAAQPEPEPQGVPVMITKKMRVDLAARGYTEAQIRGMTPQQAHAALQGEPSVQKVEPAARFLSPEEHARARYAAKVDGMVQAGKISPEQRAHMDELYEPKPSDPVTGFYDKGERGPLVARAIQHVTDTGESMHYVEADIRNLGGLNEKLGHTGADEVYRAFTDILHRELGVAGSAIGIRHGGDEVSFVVHGATDEQVQAALAKAEAAAQAHAEAQGLHTLPHSKEGRLPGTGIVTAFTALEPGDKPKSAYTRVDKEIEFKKKEFHDGKRSAPEAVGTVAPVAGSAGAENRDVRTGNPEGQEGPGSAVGSAPAVAGGEEASGEEVTDPDSDPYPFPEHRYERHVPEAGAKGKLSDFARTHVVPKGYEKSQPWMQSTDRREPEIKVYEGKGHRGVATVTTHTEYYHRDGAFSAGPTLHVIKRNGAFHLESQKYGGGSHGDSLLPGYSFPTKEAAVEGAKQLIRDSKLLTGSQGTVHVFPAHESHVIKPEAKPKGRKPKPEPAAVAHYAPHEPVEGPEHIEGGEAEPATTAAVAQSVAKANASKADLSHLPEARKFLLQEIDKAIAKAPEAENEFSNPHVYFDVPGDGKFKVVNTQSALADFRKKVEKSPGFKPKGGRHPVPSLPSLTVNAEQRAKIMAQAETVDAEDDQGEPAAAAEPAKPKKVAHPKSTAPEHMIPEDGITPLSIDQIKQVAKEWRAHIDAGGQEDVTHVFDAPTKDEIVRMNDSTGVVEERRKDADGKGYIYYRRDAGWMTKAEAKKTVNGWKKHAAKQLGENGYNAENAQKVVLSLFDKTGAWVQPWIDAGYQVYTFDIQNDPDIGDVNNFSVDHFIENFGMFEGADVYAVLAACPCTDFANSGNGSKAAKDIDGRTQLSVQLVNQTLATIEFFKPPVWAIENPVGRIEELTGLPPWRSSFHPFHFGDDYTKKTQLWGRFNADMPSAPVNPNVSEGGRGSVMHSNYGGKSQKTKDARSETPEGFAYAFFMSNNAIDNPLLAVAGEFDRLDRDKIAKALDKGVTPAQIKEAVQEFYYQELDDIGANKALDYLGKNGYPDEEAAGDDWNPGFGDNPGYVNHTFWDQFAATKDEKRAKYPDYDKYAATGYDAETDDDAEADDDEGIVADRGIRRARRQRKSPRRFKNSGPITQKRDRADLALDDRIYTENPEFHDAAKGAGMSVDDFLASMTSPKDQLTWAIKGFQAKYGLKKIKVSPDLNTIEALNQLKFGYTNVESMFATMGWPLAAASKIAPTLLLQRKAGGALAYYNPATAAIGLTRQNDSYAHEFGHAIDMWVWNQMGYMDPESGKPRGWGASGKLRLKAQLKNRPVEAAFTSLVNAMFKAHGDAAFKIMGIEKQILIQLKQIAEQEAKLPKAAIDPDRVARINASIEKKRAFIQQLIKQISTIKGGTKDDFTRDTDYYLNARLLDGPTATEDEHYFQKPTEMLARAFEAWIAYRVEQGKDGLRGDTRMLARTDEGYQRALQDIQMRYPQGIEREAIFKAFDDLADALRDDVMQGLDGKMAELQPNNPLPSASVTMFVPPEVKPVSIMGAVRDSLASDARRREAANDHNEKVADEYKRVRDMRGDKDRSGFTDKMMALNDWQKDVRRGWLGTVGTFFRQMEKRYPKSATFQNLRKIMTTSMGDGRVHSMTMDDFKHWMRRKLGNQLDVIVGKHRLMQSALRYAEGWTRNDLRDLRDTMVEDRPIAERPKREPRIQQAAKDLLKFMDFIHNFAANEGVDLGYVKDQGYLPRMTDKDAVAADEAGFTRQATKVYEHVFDEEVGSNDIENIDEIVAAGIENGPSFEMRQPRFVTLKQLHALLTKAREEGKDEEVERIIERIDGLLHDGLYDAIRKDWTETAAMDYKARILGLASGTSFQVQTATGKFMKSRVLPKEADRLLGDYMITDPLQLIVSYMNTVVNKVAFEKFIPGEKDESPEERLKNIGVALANEGVLPDHIKEALTCLQLETGLYQSNVSRAGMERRSKVQTTYMPVLLGRALYGQLVEPAAFGTLVSKNLTDVPAVFKSQASDLAAWLPGLGHAWQALGLNRGVQWRRHMAAYLGVTSAHAVDELMAHRVNALHSSPEAAARDATFYRASMIHPHANSIRRAVMERSFVYAKRMAKKALKGNRQAMRDLADVGINSNNKQLLEYLANKMPLRPSVYELENSAYAHDIFVTINRLVDRSSQDPKFNEKPRAASTPEWSFMFGLLAYNSALVQNVVYPNLRRIQSGFKDGVWRGIGNTTATAAGVSIFLTLQAVQYLLRTAIFTPGGAGDELDKWAENPWEGFLTVLSRSGLDGNLDPLINSAYALRYGRSLSELGIGPYMMAAIGWMGHMGRAAYTNSENNNNAERRIAAEAWNGVFAAVIARMVLDHASILTPALALTSSPRARDAFANAAAGEKMSGSSGHKSRHSGHNRSAGRAAGRHAGRQ